MTSESAKTFEGALAIEKKRADDRDARLRAEGWAAGAAAMRRLAAQRVSAERLPYEHGALAVEILSLPLPEYDNG